MIERWEGIVFRQTRGEFGGQTFAARVHDRGERERVEQDRSRAGRMSDVETEQCTQTVDTFLDEFLPTHSSLNHQRVWLGW